MACNARQIVARVVGGRGPRDIGPGSVRNDTHRAAAACELLKADGLGEIAGAGLWVSRAPLVPGVGGGDSGRWAGDTVQWRP